MLSLCAGLIGGKKDLAAHWALGEKAAAESGKQIRREEWRLVIRAHLARTRAQAMAEVRKGREAERIGYFERVAGLKNDYTFRAGDRGGRRARWDGRRHDRSAAPTA